MADPRESTRPSTLPREPIHRLLAPLNQFLHVEAAGGALLLACATIALVLANSSFADGFLGFWKTRVGFSIGSFSMVHSLQHWINDGLMGLFFFVIGLEVKRELVLGELRDPRRAALPIAAALGGMIVPAGVYLLLQAGESGQSGWGIPMATDIAFVVGCLAVLGERIPRGLRVLLLSLAIADDIGAILVIAIGYTDVVHGIPLLLAFVGIGFVLALARLGVRSLAVYVIVGAGVWLAFHESGVHATLAGVILGLITPTRSWVPHSSLDLLSEQVRGYLHGESWESSAQRRETLRDLETAARETLSPLERLEHSMHPWSSFLIMPIFALANAGVPLQIQGITDPVALAVAAGLVVGKPVGIFAASFLAVRAGIGDLPEGVSWSAVVGAGFLAVIGFTMALFIAGLALDGPTLDAAKLGILCASGVAAIAGVAILITSLPRRAGAP